MPLFKAVTFGEKDMGRYAGNAGKFANLVATEVTERWQYLVPEGQEFLDVKGLQIGLRDELRKQREKIRLLEREHHQKLDFNAKARKVRDRVRPQLREKLIGIRRTIDGTYGAGTSTLVFGEDLTVIPVDAFPLMRAAHIAHNNLMSPDLGLPEKGLLGVSINPTELAESFAPELAQLDEVLVGLEDTTPESNLTFEKKTRALEEAKRKALKAVRLLERLYDLTGHEIVAGKVRLSSHRQRPAGSESGGEDAGSDNTGNEPGTQEPEGEASFPFDESAAASAPSQPITAKAVQKTA